jgi:hypothetical protein
MNKRVMLFASPQLLSGILLLGSIGTASALGTY